jgi:hypothetical protein
MAHLPNPLYRAIALIQAPQTLQTRPDIYHTLDFMVNHVNAIGIKNATTQDKIVGYLHSKGFNTGLSQWQNTTLQDLKHQLIVVTVVSPGATFIPNDTTDLEPAISSLQSRITSEQQKLQNYLAIQNGL